MYRSDILRDFIKTEFNNPIWPFGDYNKLLYASVRGMIAYIPVSTATWRRVLYGSATKSGYDRSLELGMAYAECREMFMRKYPVDARLARSIRREQGTYHKTRSLRRRSGVYEECYAWLVKRVLKRLYQAQSGQMDHAKRGPAVPRQGHGRKRRNRRIPEVLPLLRTWAIPVGLRTACVTHISTLARSMHSS